jgi:hypothetical protein
VFQTDSREHGETVNDPSESLAENQSLEVGHDGLPLVVVRIRKPRQRQDLREEAMGWGDSIVSQYWDGWQHDSGRLKLSMRGFPLVSTAATKTAWSKKVER